MTAFMEGPNDRTMYAFWQNYVSIGTGRAGLFAFVLYSLYF